MPYEPCPAIRCAREHRSSASDVWLSSVGVSVGENSHGSHQGQSLHAIAHGRGVSEPRAIR